MKESKLDNYKTHSRAHTHTQNYIPSLKYENQANMGADDDVR
jgi:hypothetical protein